LAISCHRRAADMYRELGDRHYEAASRTRLGDSYLAAGDPQSARIAWQCAQKILEDLDHDAAEGIRIKLQQV
jgi:predicted negative regulator of RcsB-dependent stress response